MREANSPLPGPASLALLNLVAGPAVSGPVIGSVLYRIGRKRTGVMLAATMAITGVVICVAALLWPVKWYWSSLSLLAIQLVSSVVVYFSMRTLFVAMPERYLTGYSAARKQDKTYPFMGMIGGGILAVIVGLPVLTLFLILSDRLFALVMPVTPSDIQTVSILFATLFCLGVSGCIAGCYCGLRGLRMTPLNMLGLSVVLILTSIAWVLVLQLVVAMPGFQAGQTSGMQWAVTLFPFFSGNFFIGTWWAPFLLSYVIKPMEVREKVLRGLQVPLIHLSAGVVLVILLGYVNNIFHATGRYFERQGRVPAALWCYEQGLKRNPTAASASYLQYRVALLAHKLGNREKSLHGFRMVVSKYTHNEELVKKSNRFLDNLSRNSTDRQRVVLPGVESHIAYKGSYCVPNSLALVMRYWGSDIDARNIGERITGLNRGTYIIDQAWYAEQHGFQHDFLPNATLEDIKAAIEAGFPVMVYVPAHVFVIVGYDETLETFVTYDVATSDVWVEYIQKDFVRSWKRQGTTLVLAYPPEKRVMLPRDIQARLVTLSDGYLHYHLRYADSPQSFAAGSHLLQAIGREDAMFFIPLTILYSDFPGLRATLDARYSRKDVTDSIIRYFGSDFDEGIHLWGQYHDESRSEEDRILGYALKYLIGIGEVRKAQDLIAAIERNGPISNETKRIRGMLDLAQGEYESGVYRLKDGEQEKLDLYLALAELELGKKSAAISSLVETVDGCT
ncbi:MAG: hypothetical protein Kow0089_08570 [Desulfobulbaceae bacterium]